MIPVVVIVIGLVVAGIFGIAAIQSGGVEQSLDSFFGYLLSWQMIALIIVIGVVFIAVKNSQQKKPLWKKDMIGLSVSVVIIIVVALILPMAAGQLSGYKADLAVTLYLPVIGNPSIKGISVSNFEKATTLNIMDAPQPLFIGQTISGNAVIICDGEIVDTEAFSSYTYYLTESTVVKTIHNLPAGATCKVVVTIPTDEETSFFTVPT